MHQRGVRPQGLAEGLHSSTLLRAHQVKRKIQDLNGLILNQGREYKGTPLGQNSIPLQIHLPDMGIRHKQGGQGPRDGIAEHVLGQIEESEAGILGHCEEQFLNGGVG